MHHSQQTHFLVYSHQTSDDTHLCSVTDLQKYSPLTIYQFTVYSDYTKALFSCLSGFRICFWWLILCFFLTYFALFANRPICTCSLIQSLQSALVCLLSCLLNCICLSLSWHCNILFYPKLFACVALHWM